MNQLHSKMREVSWICDKLVEYQSSGIFHNKTILKIKHLRTKLCRHFNVILVVCKGFGTDNETNVKSFELLKHWLDGCFVFCNGKLQQKGTFSSAHHSAGTAPYLKSFCQETNEFIFTLIDDGVWISINFKGGSPYFKIRIGILKIKG